MFPEENEIRRALADRRAPSRDPWPEIRDRLDVAPTSLGRRAVSGALALVVFLAAAETFRNGMDLPRRDSSEFRVTGVSRNGRPADAVIVHPDRDTIVVVVQ